jgi:membrane protein implicated in regulation of membrane protease activity
VNRLWALVVAAFVAGVGLDLVVGASLPGFTAALGFVGCAVLVFVSKGVGKRLLKRPESYYADPVVEEDLGDAS